MTRTFCTIIRDPGAEAALGPWAEINAHALPWLFREIHVRKAWLAAAKSAAQKRFGLTGRQVNGLRFDLDQAVAAWRGGLKHRATMLGDRIEAVGEQIGTLDRKIAEATLQTRKNKLWGRRHQKMRHLGIQRDRLAAAERDLARDVPRLCFGGRGLLRRGETAAWRLRRASRINLVGAACETAGNQTAQWTGESLRLRLPDALGGAVVELAGVAFRYGQSELLAALRRKAGITWLLFRDAEGVWRAHATIDEKEAEKITDARCGVVSVDLNVDHLAVVLVDRSGNPMGRETIPFPEAGTPADAALAMIGDAASRLVALAVEDGRHFGIAVEDLDFTKKKAALKSFGKRHARRLSGFAYAAFFDMLSARCARSGIDLVEVNPAFTSVIGGLKYARGRAMTRHHAAALVIGRRALGFGERFVSMGHGTLVGAGSSRPRHAWSRWRGARPMASAGARQRAPDRGVGGGTSGKGRLRRGSSPHLDGPPGRQGRPGARTRVVRPSAGAAVGPAGRSTASEACITA